MAANFILGVGISMHKGRVRAPWGLRSLSRLLVEDRLGDFDRLMAIVIDNRDKADPILPRYIGDWWSTFADTAPSAQVKYFKLVEFWQKQEATLPKPIMISSEILFNLAALTENEMDEAWGIANDAMSFVSNEIESSYDGLLSIAQTIAKVEKIKTDLEGMVESAEAQIVSDLPR
ncbi:hypothetical protein DFP72DRAFT_1071543 [Ephemerocybe angulata]|uniref:Uncharacterized protein n=1 Tax=Ephemerocybe angulata TaxID=980116 RepID=A0A8H6HS39_9AGAR|nr:hypothetical protein DFP72DRAFT_1071543 [Tulosesus angulatus]